MEFKIGTVQFLCSVTKCLGILIWVTTSTVVGALLVTAGEMITWLELDMTMSLVVIMVNHCLQLRNLKKMKDNKNQLEK